MLVLISKSHRDSKSLFLKELENIGQTDGQNLLIKLPHQRLKEMVPIELF